MNRIRTNHNFTKSQLKALNNELKEVSNTEIVGMKGISIPAKNNFSDVDVKRSPYTSDVFLSYIDISIPDSPKSYIYSISKLGLVNKDCRRTLEFKTFADRVHFFNTLESIEFTY